MTEGGLLSVLRSFLAAANSHLPQEWSIVALVHKAELVPGTRATLIEFPHIKRSWGRRLFFEWISSRRLATKLRADVWVSLQDITALVNTRRQFVYCHNPTCFASWQLRFTSLRWDRTFFLHSAFYGFLYSLNINRNDAVLVQQHWIAEAFQTRFRASRAIVCRPSHELSNTDQQKSTAASRWPIKTWLYPTFSRHFKNIEVVGEALSILERDLRWSGEVLITITPEYSAYARWIARRFGHLKSLRFIGRVAPEHMAAIYQRSDCLLFPSRLETWGLPITEAQHYALPLLVADLPYAHEAVGTYDKVCYFEPTDPKRLADLMLDLNTGKACFGSSAYSGPGNSTVISGWDSLIEFVTEGLH